MATSTLTLNDTVTVDYDRRGNGPALLLIPGGAGHGGIFDQLASHLADHYDVVAMSSRVASKQRPDAITSESSTPRPTPTTRSA